MNVEAYIICFNEAETIHLTIKHYQQFCSRIVIFDNFSTDNTREIAISMGCDVRLFGQKGVLSDKEYLKVKNHCWKKSRADWVIVCDSDEILYHHNLQEALKEDCTIFTTYGWNVYSEEMPKGTALDIKTGYHDGNYSKSIIFKPTAVKEINYHLGCHACSPRGDIRKSKEQLILFHIRNVGGYQRLSDRHAMYRTRMSEDNIQRKLGIHYMFEEKIRKIDWYQKHENSKEFDYIGI